MNYTSILETLVIGIIATWIAKPLLKYFVKQVNKISNFVYTKLSFRKYNYNINISVLFVGMIIILGIFVPKQVDFEKEIQGYSKVLTTYKEGEKEEKEDLTRKEELHKLEKQIEFLEIFNTGWKILIYAMIIFIAFCYALSEIVNTLLSEFERDLKVLKPIIIKKDFEQLESLWAQMRSIEDFRNIREKIKILKENISS